MSFSALLLGDFFRLGRFGLSLRLRDDFSGYEFYVFTSHGLAAGVHCYSSRVLGYAVCNFFYDFTQLFCAFT